MFSSSIIILPWKCYTTFQSPKGNLPAIIIKTQLNMYPQSLREKPHFEENPDSYLASYLA
jgi:hypothetical protein